MRAIITIFILLTLGLGKVNAQTSTQVTQQVDISLTNVIVIKFVSTGTNTGGSLSLPITSLTDLVNGIASNTQQLTVSSTKGFNVTAKTTSSNFTYTGSFLLNNLMPASKLRMRVTANSTGGSIAGNFANYTALSSSAQSIINNGTLGNNKTFTVQYQGLPGLGYALGSYSISVVYTATQQ